MLHLHKNNHGSQKKIGVSLIVLLPFIHIASLHFHDYGRKGSLQPVKPAPTTSPTNTPGLVSGHRCAKVTPARKATARNINAMGPLE